MAVGVTDTRIVWFEGEFRDANQLHLSAFDFGLTVGLGVFDSMCGYDGVPFDFAKHYKRLQDGAARMGLTTPNKEELYSVICECIVRNDLQVGRSRIRVTLLEGEAETKSIVSVSEVPQRAVYSKCVISDYRVNERSPLAGIKATSYAMNMLALREAAKQGADEAIFYNTQGLLCEGATSNIFMVKNGVVKTPLLDSGCLPGVARDTVIELCHEVGFSCEEAELLESDFHECDAAFLTSSLREVQRIESIDGRNLLEADCSIIEDLQQAYRARYESL